MQQPAAPAVPSGRSGLLLCALIALGSYFLSIAPFYPFTMDQGRHPIEPVMLALLAGILLQNMLKLNPALRPGISVAVKKVLPIGIIFLGARLNLQDLAKIGGSGAALTVLEVLVAIALFRFFAPIFKLTPKLTTLLAVGTAICGGTAIVAVAPVIEAEKEEIAFSITTISVLGLVMMLALPGLGELLHLTPSAYGYLAGLTIHQTPQVVAAGFAFSQQAGELATVVKLARVCFLAPIVFLISLAQIRRSGSTQQIGSLGSYLKLIPYFVYGFVAMALLRTVGAFSLADWLLQSEGSTVSACTTICTACLIVSMAGVGLDTDFRQLKAVGLRPFLAGALAIAIIAAMILALTIILGV